MEHLGFPLETVILFAAVVVLSLFLDLFAHRRDEVISFKSACLWSVFWVALALAFGVYLYVHHSPEMASLFFTGYALEKVLSVDNLFVMMAIFSWFSIPGQYRHRVLYWGVLGAIVFRAIFVAIGAELMSLGPYVELLFAVIVGYTAVMVLKKKDDEEEIKDYSNHLAFRMVRRFFPVWPRLCGHTFFLSREKAMEESQRDNIPIEGMGRASSLVVTPLFLCLAVIEVSDVMFAFDSVPAVIAVSREPFIIYSAMIFAILGLRSLYFVLESMSGSLVYLEKAVIVLLFFIAFKLMLSGINHIFHVGFEISPNVSLIIVLGVLATGIIASLLHKPEAKEPDGQADGK
ncbi:MAG: TerC/Alx family metal homeostasis membrane protein [Desulfovibrionaceae bacterium]|nr:TerC/Alx family metal homeostasis membrane protein [Desulfovibrionaceae bacterium]